MRNPNMKGLLVFKDDYWNAHKDAHFKDMLHPGLYDSSMINNRYSLKVIFGKGEEEVNYDITKDIDKDGMIFFKTKPTFTTSKTSKNVMVQHFLELLVV